MNNKIDNIYDNPITYENIYKIWKIVRKTCKNRKAVYRFELNKNTNIYNIYKALKERKYKPLPFRPFLIFEPKPRLVMSQSVTDKIVNHFVANYYILPYLENKLIDSNVATRKNKGSSYADKLLLKYLNTLNLKNNNEEIYCLKIDISKYFYTINHNILIDKIKKYIIDQDVLNIISVIINETNEPYINKLIDKYNSKYYTDIPYYEKDVGLSIGAMTSQFLAIYYLNDLDHLIKEKLRCKYYIRYMDDFIILDTNKEKLKEVWQVITKEINRLGLKINPKSNLLRMSIGLNFLGYRYQVIKDKLYISFRKKTIRKISKKLSYLKVNNIIKYYKSYSSYYGYLNKVKKCERKFIMKSKDKYDYYKNKYPDCVILIKEGSFYKTYKDDAIILWYLFGYKWNNESISFGITPYSKVLNKLNSLGIGYAVLSEDELVIPNDFNVYRLYKDLSVINYDKYNKRQELHSLLDSLLDQSFDNYSPILERLNEFLKSS